MCTACIHGNGFTISIILLSIVSLFALGAQKVLIDDIARQSRLGLDVPEIAVLNVTYLLNIALTIVMFLLFVHSFRMGDAVKASHTSGDETIFTPRPVHGDRVRHHGDLAHESI